MKIIFSSHAILKIGQRGLSRQAIIAVVTQPSFSRPSYGSREELYGKFGKNHLKVVIRRENNQITVITAHWVAKLRKG